MDGDPKMVPLSSLILLASLPLVHAASPVPVPIAPASTTCAFYLLAYEYAQEHVQPNITESQKAAVFDALALQNCPKASHRLVGAHHGDRRAPRPRCRQRGGHRRLRRCGQG